MTRSYDGAVALVTGAASGIGRALAAELAARGARVVLADRDLDGARRAADEIAAQLAHEGRGGSAEGVALDVTDAAAFAAVVHDVTKRLGPIDVLVSNAGVGVAGEVRDLTLDDWRRVIDVNLWGVVHGIAAVYPGMAERGRGHVVNVASGAGLAPRPGMTPYAAAKWAVVGLSTSLRAEAMGLGVRVTVVCPGNIATSIAASTRFVNVDGGRLLAEVPIRAVSAEECARRIVRGMERNRAYVLVGWYVWLDWWLFRAAPSLSIRLSEWRVRRFRAHRREP